MDSFYAPYLKASDSLQHAVEQMDMIQSPALVVKSGLEHYLFSSKIVFNVFLEGKTVCEELFGHEKFSIVNIESVAQEKSSLLLPPQSWGPIASFFENILDKAGADYGFLFPSSDSEEVSIVVIVTRQEEFKRRFITSELRRNKVCACTGTFRHAATEKPVPNECVLCGSPIHCTISL